MSLATEQEFTAFSVDQVQREPHFEQHVPNPELFNEQVSVVHRLSELVAQAIEYLRDEQLLEPGVSEFDIAQMVRGYLAEHGVTEFWYKNEKVDLGIMVLIGERFSDMTLPNYEDKSSRKDVLLPEVGSTTIFIDIHAQATAALVGSKEHSDRNWWTDWATTIIWGDPGDPYFQAQLVFTKIMCEIHTRAIQALRPDMTGAELYEMVQEEFKRQGIGLVDVRGNLGHRMLWGTKGEYGHLRQFLDGDHQLPLGHDIYGIEVGGYKVIKIYGEERVLVARLERCAIATPGGGGVLGPTRPHIISIEKPSKHTTTVDP